MNTMEDMKVNKATRKMLRNILWTMAGLLAVGALIYNPAHLATASLIFILGTFQDDEMKEGR
jgi:hypothetical protein